MKMWGFWLAALALVIFELMVSSGVWAQQSRRVDQQRRPIQRAGPETIQSNKARPQRVFSMGDPPGARYYSISPWDFSAHRNPSPVGWNHTGSVGMMGSGNAQEGLILFGAGVHLPDGAVIRGWRAWVRDNNPKARMESLRLEQSPLSSGNRIQVGNRHETTAEHDTPQVLLMQERSLSTAVDNRNHSYSMTFDVSGSKVELLGAVIVYTLPE